MANHVNLGTKAEMSLLTSIYYCAPAQFEGNDSFDRGLINQ